MRPLDKGEPSPFVNRATALALLHERIGDYCSYCEVWSTTLEVEHVQPSSKNEELAEDWQNLLLACGKCNKTKADKDVKLEDVFLPHLCNTLLRFEYQVDGQIVPHPSLSPEDIEKAKKTLSLLGLDSQLSNMRTSKKAANGDNRWHHRALAWIKATNHKKRLEQGEIDVEYLIDFITERGYFSIWWTVFQDNLEIKKRIREAFRGTRSECFDQNEELMNFP